MRSVCLIALLFLAIVALYAGSLTCTNTQPFLRRLLAPNRSPQGFASRTSYALNSRRGRTHSFLSAQTGFLSRRKSDGPVRP